MKAVQLYLNNVKKALTCPNGHKAQFLEEIAPLLDEFITNNPQTSYTDLVYAFGHEESLAESFLQILDPNVIRVELKRRLFLKRIAISLLAVFLLGTLFLFAYSSHVRHTVSITKESTIIIYEDGK